MMVADSSRLRFGLLCLLSYVALSWAVRFDMPRGAQVASLVYPLDTFSMYSNVTEGENSHLLLRDEQGRVHAITSFHAFDCDTPIDSKDSVCNARHGLQYLEDDLANHVLSHPGSGTMTVDVIRRTWAISAGQQPKQIGDCVITTCRVSR